MDEYNRSNSMKKEFEVLYSTGLDEARAASEAPEAPEGVTHHHTVSLGPETTKPATERPSVFFLTTIGWDQKTQQSRSRCVGWFSTFEDAEEHVLNNYGDIEEAGYYRWAVIEKMECGLYPTAYYEENHWYEFVAKNDNADGWDPHNVTAVPIDRPDQFEGTINFGIG